MFTSVASDKYIEICRLSAMCICVANLKCIQIRGYTTLLICHYMRLYVANMLSRDQYWRKGK